MDIIKFSVTRKNDTVIVYLMRNKIDNTYSFVNMTKGHICPCRFDTIDSAISDMEKQKKDGKILRYKEIE